jgi:hypothetical protein
LRQQYGLGGDPYDPHDNILAGAAYIRDMYAIYGSPGFLAAYNAGPDRLATYLAGGGSLPDETVNYLASVAPLLGSEVPMTGPLAVYAGGGMVVASAAAAAPADPADRAFDGGGLVTPDAPTGAYSGPVMAGRSVTPAVAPAAYADRGVAAQALVAPAALVGPVAPLAAPLPRGGGWAIQVGAFPDPAHSQAVIAAARARAADLLAAAQPAVIPVQRGGVLYRARLVGLSGAGAEAACSRLSASGIDCFAVPPGF